MPFLKWLTLVPEVNFAILFILAHFSACFPCRRRDVNVATVLQNEVATFSPWRSLASAKPGPMAREAR